MKKAMLVTILAGLAPVTAAEVTNSAANGFTTVNEVIIDRDRAATWDAAVGDIGAWWNSAHTISGDAASLRIDPVVQGCFCETLGENAGVVHLTVTTVIPAVMLRLTGGLGPLGLMGVDGNMTWEFDDVDAGTRVRFTYAVGGYRDGGLDAMAPSVDAVIGEALDRLQAYIETGSPERAPVE